MRLHSTTATTLTRVPSNTNAPGDADRDATIRRAMTLARVELQKVFPTTRLSEEQHAKWRSFVEAIDALSRRAEEPSS